MDNKMTFFSSTDIATLREEGNDRNHFVSLIVNNAGTYTAAITRKLLKKSTLNTVYTYNTFDDAEKSGTSTEEITEEVLEYNMLDIIKEGEVTEPFLEIDERLAAIKENKQKPAVKAIEKGSGTIYCYDSDNQLPFPKPNYYKETDKKYVSQPSLFDDRYQEFYDDYYMESSPIRKISEDTITVKKSDIDSIVLQLITGSIAISDLSKIDPVKWAGQMEKLFDKRFNNNMNTFRLWAETFVEFIISGLYFDQKYSYMEDEYYSELSVAVYDELEKLPSNKYIKEIQTALTLWMK